MESTLNHRTSDASCPPQNTIETGSAAVAVIKHAFIPGSWLQANTRSTRARLVIRGGAWSVVGYAGTQLLRTAATLVLARYLLGPEPFGVVGLVAVFLAGLAMFS